MLVGLFIGVAIDRLIRRADRRDFDRIVAGFDSETAPVPHGEEGQR